MRITRPWRIAATSGAAALLAGGLGAGAALATDRIQLQDQMKPSQSNTTTVDDCRSLADADPSPESADSPASSPFDSANSPHDSPGDKGYDASPESADSPNRSAADSPAGAPTTRGGGDDSAGSSGSAGSADSPDSGASS